MTKAPGMALEADRQLFGKALAVGIVDECVPCRALPRMTGIIDISDGRMISRVARDCAAVNCVTGLLVRLGTNSDKVNEN